MATFLRFISIIVECICVINGLHNGLQPGFILEEYVSQGSLTHPRQMISLLYNDSIVLVYVCVDGGVDLLIDNNNDGSNDDILYSVVNTKLINPNPNKIKESCNSIVIRNEIDMYVSAWNVTYKCSPTLPYISLHEQAIQTGKLDCVTVLTQPYYTHHGRHYTVINPNTNQLCMGFGVPCNICELNPNDPIGTISCFNDINNLNINDMTMMADGLRDPIGMMYHPLTNELWFTDHNRDDMGNERPDGELNKIDNNNIGQHYGFPYCHSLGKPDTFEGAYNRNPGPGNVSLLIDDRYGDVVNNICDESVYRKAEQALGL